MRLSGSRMAQAASISAPVDPGMRLSGAGGPDPYPACVYLGTGCDASISARLTQACVYLRSRWTQACVYLGGWRHGLSGASMRLSRGRLTQACVYLGAGGPSMRLSRGRWTQACVYLGVGWTQACVGWRRWTQACVYLGAGGPKHGLDGPSYLRREQIFRGERASISGRSISEPVDPSMRLSRSRWTQACVYLGAGGPKHASISGRMDPSMRLFRGRMDPACVYLGAGDPSMRLSRSRSTQDFGVGDPSMRLSRSRMAQACVYLGAG